ncbi:DNA glycosylase [Cylindrobasidium torrendii FP15055 ss-10]|uniref:DNA glycosylase n=1 Tax=Cylindrobasidium torrendii FP15055 ss-10 TaxID=1314674 RepID=A0A0D7B0I6_9AGAR|nr:DNA glycosylase [Cylindrobasidium torrendii FP15055 ss-10]
MPVTRSATRVTAEATPAPTSKRKQSNPIAPNGSKKAKPSSTPPEPVPTSKRKAPTSASKNAPKSKPVSVAPIDFVIPQPRADEEHVTLIPAILTFSFEDAKKHLIKADFRFEDLFDKRKCTPFEVLEQIHPFRSLATSIIGQQISWKAAKSINHKFKRLYDPSLPEDANDYDGKSHTSSFPTPSQVAGTELSVLRTAGLSGRKAEYIQDLASRFADGRLTTEKLINATDEDLFEMLIAIKGVGPWTVDMFAFFTLRRPNILPVGDLGVQKGVARWILSLHSADYEYKVEGDRLPGASSQDNAEVEVTHDALERSQPLERGATPDMSSVVPAVPSTPPKLNDELPMLPPAFTPSIVATLRKTHDEAELPKLPPGLSVAELKARLNGKKKVSKGQLLTAAEMEALTEPWAPYRSLAVYYMWALVDG